MLRFDAREQYYILWRKNRNISRHGNGRCQYSLTAKTNASINPNELFAATTAAYATRTTKRDNDSN